VIVGCSWIVSLAFLTDTVGILRFTVNIAAMSAASLLEVMSHSRSDQGKLS
jgi:hypothetical protein